MINFLIISFKPFLIATIESKCTIINDQPKIRAFDCIARILFDSVITKCDEFLILIELWDETINYVYYYVYYVLQFFWLIKQINDYFWKHKFGNKCLASVSLLEQTKCEDARVICLFLSKQIENILLKWVIEF